MKQRLLTLLCLLCCLSASTAWADTTVENTIAKIADDNGWVNGTAYKSWSLDNVVTISCTGGGNSGKYYTSGEDWRLYQTENATMSIQTKAGDCLKSVNITYSIANTGILSDPNNNNITSGEDVSISGTTTTSVAYHVGNTKTATNGQVKVTAISVTYSSTGGVETKVATPTFTPEGGEFTEAQNVTIACETEGASIYYTTGEGDPEKLYGDPIFVSETTTIKAIAVKDGMDNSDVATATYTINQGGKITPGLKFEPQEVTIHINNKEEFTEPVLTTDPEELIETITLTYSSSDTDVATIDAEGKVTINAVGITKIKAYFAGDDDYNEAYATYTLNVDDYIFYESFDKCNSKGGNDNTWGGITTGGDIVADNNGWSFTEGKGARECARFGTSKVKGSATTPAFGKDLIAENETMDCYLTFKAGAWKGDGKILNISVNEGKFPLSEEGVSQTSVELKNEEWTEYSLYIIGATANTQIKFEAEKASSNRFFLDEVYVRECNVKIGEAGVATFCSRYALDFTNSGVKAYIATGTNDDETAVMLTNVPDAPAEKGLILKAAKGSYYVPRTSEVKTDVTGNLLKGVLDETKLYATSDGCTNYILARDKSTGKVAFHPIDTNSYYTLSAGKAYLSILETVGLPPVPMKIVFDDEEATGIEAVKCEEVENGDMYNLQGNKVDDNFKGIVIKNGKKFYNR